MFALSDGFTFTANAGVHPGSFGGAVGGPNPNFDLGLAFRDLLNTGLSIMAGIFFFTMVISFLTKVKKDAVFILVLA